MVFKRQKKREETYIILHKSKFSVKKIMLCHIFFVPLHTYIVVNDKNGTITKEI